MASTTLRLLAVITAVLLLGGCAGYLNAEVGRGLQKFTKTGDSRCGSGFAFNTRKARANGSDVWLLRHFTSNFRPCTIFEITNGQLMDVVRVRNGYTGDYRNLKPGEQYVFVLQGHKNVAVTFTATILDEHGRLTGWVQPRTLYTGYGDGVSTEAWVVRWVQRPNIKEVYEPPPPPVIIIPGCHFFLGLSGYSCY